MASKFMSFQSATAVESGATLSCGGVPSRLLSCVSECVEKTVETGREDSRNWRRRQWKLEKTVETGGEDSGNWRRQRKLGESA